MHWQVDLSCVAKAMQYLRLCNANDFQQNIDVLHQLFDDALALSLSGLLVDASRAEVGCSSHTYIASLAFDATFAARVRASRKNLRTVASDICLGPTLSASLAHRCSAFCRVPFSATPPSQSKDC